MMMIFFLSSSCRFVEVWRRERDDQISKLSLPFSSSTSSARASEPLEIKCLCIHYSLVSVRIWWWYWWWWKWSEWIDRSREVQEAAGERRKRNFLLFSFFFHLFWKRRFVCLIINRQTQSSEEKRRSFSFAKFLSLSLSLFLSRRAHESQHALTTLILFS